MKNENCLRQLALDFLAIKPNLALLGAISYHHFLDYDKGIVLVDVNWEQPDSTWLAAYLPQAALQQLPVTLAHLFEQADVSRLLKNYKPSIEVVVAFYRQGKLKTFQLQTSPLAASSYFQHFENLAHHEVPFENLRFWQSESQSQSILVKQS